MNETITISDGWRLLLYNAMGVWPVWSDWAAKSMDTSFRGLIMPILSTLSVITAITLAKTSTRRASLTAEGAVKTEVVNTAADPLPVTETKARKKDTRISPNKKR